MTLEPTKRRRGIELEHAILDSAWEVLLDGGYSAFTVESVAERARTSRHVVYRRWPTRGDLVLAAIRHESARSVPVLPDTGSLRGDVLALLTGVEHDRKIIAAVLSVHFGTYYRETGTTPADLHRSITGDQTGFLETIFQRAAARGEIPTADVGARVMNLPGDLLRYEVLMKLEPTSEATLLEIVDDVFLPLVRRG